MSIGIGLGFRARRSDRFSTPAFSPADIADLLGWYDASNTASIVSSGGLVSQWDDLSGGGHHLTQSSSGARPSTDSVTINGRNALTFNDKYMNAPSSIGGYGGYRGAAFTILSVWKTNAPSAAYDQWLWNGESATVGVAFAGGSDEIQGYKYQDNFGFASSLSITPDETQHVVGHRVSGGSQQVYYDGTFSGVNSAGSTTGSSFIFGAYNQYGGFMNGEFGEIVAYNRALSDEEIGQIASYFSAKWGTP